MLLQILGVLFLFAVIIYAIHKKYEPTVSPVEPVPKLPSHADPKLAAKQPKNKKRVAVVGGSGNIGYVVTEQLCQDESYDEVVIMDIRPPMQGLPSNPKTGVSFVKLDITNTDACIQALTGFTHVVQTAAMIELRDRPIHRYRCHLVNVRGTWNLLNAAILNGVKSYVYTTSAILGQTEKHTHCEDEDELLHRARSLPYPNDAYRTTKIKATNLVLEANGRGGMHACCIGFVINFSPYDYFVIGNLRADRFRFGHDEYPTASVASALSIAEAHCLALKKLDETPAKVGGQVFMISDFNMPFKEFYNRAYAALGKTGIVPSMPDRLWYSLTRLIEFVDWLFHGTISSPYMVFMGKDSDIQSRRSISVGESKKAQELLGFKPRPIEEGLKWLSEQCLELDKKLNSKK